jgi:hypothetical protein
MKRPVADGCLILFVLGLVLFALVFRRVYSPADIEIGLKHLEDVKAFNQVFPNHYQKKTGAGLFWGNESWVSMTVAYDRYIVDMLFGVDTRFFIFGKWRLKKRSDVFIQIWEATKVSEIGGGLQVEAGKQKLMRFTHFPSIKHVDELFELAGIEPIKDQPVAGVEDYVRRSTHTK